jgi:hypothetical protein
VADVSQTQLLCCSKCRFWGLFFALVTFGIWALKPEVEGYSEEELRTKERAHALLHPEEIEKGGSLLMICVPEYMIHSHK